MMARTRPGSGTFGFVIPVVNPGGRKIVDYGVVEAVLFQTLTSLSRQDWPDTRVVVVCHRTPDWAERFADWASFLEIGDHPDFRANLNDVYVDKGLKYMVGLCHLLAVHSPELVMLMDGDDFLHRDLCRRMMTWPKDEAAPDGFVLLRGLHVALGRGAEGFRVSAAFVVEDFDLTCGTCRAHRTKTLEALMHRFGLTVADRIPDPGPEDVAAACSRVADLLRAGGPEAKHLLRLVGEHIDFEGDFRFTEIDEPLAAKGCGHGNHDGPKQGEIHWRRIRGIMTVWRFLDEFGLAGPQGLRPEPSARLLGRGVVALAKNWLRPWVKGPQDTGRPQIHPHP